MIGCAILTMLNELDRAEHLKPDSKIQDLPLVMLMTLKWSYGQEDIDEEYLAWRNTVVAYAKKGGIDLKSTPLGGAQKLLDSVDEEQANEDLGPAKADRWGWKQKVSRILTSEHHMRRWLIETDLIVEGLRSKSRLAEAGKCKTQDWRSRIRHHEDVKQGEGELQL